VPGLLASRRRLGGRRPTGVTANVSGRSPVALHPWIVQGQGGGLADCCSRTDGTGKGWGGQGRSGAGRGAFWGSVRFLGGTERGTGGDGAGMIPGPDFQRPHRLGGPGGGWLVVSNQHIPCHGGRGGWSRTPLRWAQRGDRRGGAESGFPGKKTDKGGDHRVSNDGFGPYAGNPFGGVKKGKFNRGLPAGMKSAGAGLFLVPDVRTGRKKRKIFVISSGLAPAGGAPGAISHRGGRHWAMRSRGAETPGGRRPAPGPERRGGGAQKKKTWAQPRSTWMGGAFGVTENRNLKTKLGDASWAWPILSPRKRYVGGTPWRS